MILINFKIYKETFGEKAVELAKIIKEISEKYKIRIILCAGALDAWRLKELGLEVWLQNVDEYSEGKHSGSVSMEQAMALGIKGSLLNHSENQKAKGTVQKIIKNKPKMFQIMACAKSVGQIDWINRAKPEYVLYEPPELIGSTTDSVASRPESIKKAVEKTTNSKLIVGAGVKSGEDVRIAMELGAKGVGLASAFVLGKNPREVLEDIASGFGGKPVII